MQVIGFCRFSYPAEGGFQVEHSSLTDRIAYLYDPARIEERFRHFECLCLPGLKAQTDPDFLFVILVGEAMPMRWLERLAELIGDFPQAVIVSRPPGPHRQVCQDVINAVRDMDQPCLQFRHDDDDGVAIDFVAHLRQAAQDCAPLLAQHRLVGFDWNRGYVGRPDAQGICAEVQVTPYWGVAQAMAVRPGVRQTIMNFGHNKLNQNMPTVTFTQPVMYLRGHNDHNDSRQKRHVKPVPLPRLDATGEAELKARLAIDANHVRQVFSGA
ncbi:putative rhamnosyl transferase [Antarctobacter heliothermus]|uniref:Putative rhamnosyl transferase n=1 Tax=Antarctobacter heliothermus TaxID=74033 RepID=A0A239K9Z3_9RHOB|nr:putative rhamnosyl transferase [Antarctobacter heliothermus]SNT15266.1 Putative rhamnosyl transferase [Antarctobacter heliothermus]